MFQLYVDIEPILYDAFLDHMLFDQSHYCKLCRKLQFRKTNLAAMQQFAALAG